MPPASRKSGSSSNRSRAAKETTPPTPPWNGNLYVGIDENGMGPRLGPLIVTSVLAEVDAAGAKWVSSKTRGSFAKRMGDSKKLVAFDDSALGEAWARVISARSGGNARTPQELLGDIMLDPEEALRKPCPGHHADLCWGTEGESFAATDDTLKACSKDLEKLEKKGVRIRGVRVAVICTRRLNEAATRGLSRFDVDLHTMERLALRAREEGGADIYALCGKVGGFGFYGDRFGPLAGWLRTTLLETRARSEYQIHGLGRLAFLRDADESAAIVGLASLVGKWARDHLMRRVVRYHRADIPDLPDASGYHDPVTTRFIEASTLVRKNRRIEEACFERVSLYPKVTVVDAADAPVTTSSKKKPGRPKKASQAKPTTSPP